MIQTHVQTLSSKILKCYQLPVIAQNIMRQIRIKFVSCPVVLFHLHTCAATELQLFGMIYKIANPTATPKIMAISSTGLAI